MHDPGAQIDLGGGTRTIWSAEDITELRRIEHEVRELNVELEDRVQKRTEELRKANASVSTTVEHLQLAQSRAGALGKARLAGFPGRRRGPRTEHADRQRGNGRQHHARRPEEFPRAQCRRELKRSLLDSFVEAVETGSLIAERNLERAAELVTSFKQVAADQTTSQRREFRLDEGGA